MQGRFSLRRAWRIACAAFYQWVIDPRMIVALSMTVFIRSFAVAPLTALSREMQTPLNVVEPYIAVLNSRTLCLLIPAVYVFLISDCPRLDSSSLFLLHRTSRREWVTGQLLFFALTALAFSLLIFLCAVLPNSMDAFAANGWSTVVTKYAVWYPEKSASFAATLVKGELYHQITPCRAALMSFALSLLYELLLTVHLLLFRVLNLRRYGIAAATGIIGLGSAFGLFHAPWMWIFPAAHTVVELHYTKYLRTPVMPIGYSFLYFAVLITAMFAVCLCRVRNTGLTDADIAA